MHPVIACQSCGGMPAAQAAMAVRTAHALVLAALLLAAGARGQSVGNSPVSNDPVEVVSGLNLFQSVDGIGNFSGRILTSTAAADSTSLVAGRNDTDGWFDHFACDALPPDPSLPHLIRSACSPAARLGFCLASVAPSHCAMQNRWAARPGSSVGATPILTAAASL